jgi:hypothetical protein
MAERSERLRISGLDGVTTIQVRAHLLPNWFGMLFVLTLFFTVHAFFVDFTSHAGEPFSHGFGGSNARPGHFVARSIGFETTPYFATMLLASWIQALVFWLFAAQSLTLTLDQEAKRLAVTRRIRGLLVLYRECDAAALRCVVERRHSLLEYGGASVPLRSVALEPSPDGWPLLFGQGLSKREFRQLVGAIRTLWPEDDSDTKQELRTRAIGFESVALGLAVAPLVFAVSAAAMTALRTPAPPPPRPPPTRQADLVIGGEWYAVVTDARVGSYTARVTLANAYPGHASGSVRYSPMPCRTTLSFERLEDETYVYQQRRDEGSCLGPEPTLTFKLEGDGRLRWKSYDDQRTRRSSGWLERMNDSET